MNFAVVTAAGKGTRFGGGKALHLLRGRPLLAHAISNFDNHAAIEEVIVTVPSDSSSLQKFEKICAAEHFKKIRFITGGETRFESVRNAVQSIRDNRGIVLIHDAARPLISLNLIDQVLAGAEKYGAAVPVQPIGETVKQVEGHRIIRTISRDNLFVAQTPQAFQLEALLSAYSKITDLSLTDEAMLMEQAGVAVHVVPGDKKNIKITEAGDIQIAESFL